VHQAAAAWSIRQAQSWRRLAAGLPTAHSTSDAPSLGLRRLAEAAGCVGPGAGAGCGETAGTRRSTAPRFQQRGQRAADPGPNDGDDWVAARQLAFLPPSLGVSASSQLRVSPAAYWAAWADALPVLHHATPTQQTGSYVNSRVSQRRRACVQPPTPRASLLASAGRIERIGPPAFKAPQPPQRTISSALEGQAGSDMRLSHLTLPFEPASCSQP